MTQEFRWIGPYISKGRGNSDTEKRHADDLTLKHVVDLRKQVRELERQVNNFDEYFLNIHHIFEEIRKIIRQSSDPSSDILRLIDNVSKRNKR